MQTETEKLLELAARVEALSGPDRLIDGVIHNSVTGEFCHFTSRRRMAETADGGQAMTDGAEVLKDGAVFVLPAYTASLDAAKMSIPEGWAVSTGHGVEGDEGSYTTILEWNDWTGEEPVTVEASGNVWAASVVAAALRARATKG